MLATLAADRAIPAAVAELDRNPFANKHAAANEHFIANARGRNSFRGFRDA
jgi:hypothetical protein